MTTPGRRLLLLLAVYFVTRFYGLGLLPPFLDEAVHVRWANQVAQGESLGKSWTDGKLVSIWLSALVVRLGSDGLWACRAVTVGIGALTLWASYETATRLFSPAVGVVAGVLYIFCPFTLFHDRMVLTDGFLSAFAALCLLFSVRLARAPTLGNASGVAAALVLAVLSKASGLLVFCLPVLAVVLLRHRRPGSLRLLGVAYAIAAGLVAYPLLVFFRVTHQYQKSILADGTSDPLAGLLGNIVFCQRWLTSYWTLPLVALLVLGLVAMLVTRSREAWLLGLAGALPLGAVVLVASVWFPRYLLFTTPPLLVLAAFGGNWAATALHRRTGFGPALPVLLLGLALVPALRFDHALWTEPARAPLPDVDRDQYINGWTSGYGVREAAAFLRGELTRAPELVVFTHALSKRTTLMGLRLAFRDDPRVEIRDADLGDLAVVERLTNEFAGRTAYAVLAPKLDENRVRPPQPERWPQARLLLSTFKPNGHLSHQVYRLASP